MRGHRRFGFRRKHHRRPHGLCLSDLQAGEKALVTTIGGSEHFRIRLMEMGLLAGDEVEVSKYAPLQDPVELIVKGYHLALRVRDAAKIGVERIDD